MYRIAMKLKKGCDLPMIRKLAVLLVPLAALFTAAVLCAQNSGHIIRLDPALDLLISPAARIETVKDGFGFLEGPVWVHSSKPGFLLFSDIPANVIDKWTPTDGKVSVFLDKSGFSGADPGDAGVQSNNGKATVILYGSNGITLDKQGRVTYCQHGDRAVMRLEKDGKRTLLADRFEGKRLNSPNDLVYKSDGALYFTDPPYGLRKLADDPKKELPFSGVYRLANGKLQLLNKDFQTPNGLAFSPDEKILYVDDTASRTYWRFDVQPDGTLANKKLLIDMSASKEAGGPDGMKIDKNGNIYGAGPGGVWVLAPNGEHLGTIQPPENPANLAWGDADGKTLYFTARTGLYRLRVNIPGIRP
jgi:gluconolactonase